MDNLVQIGKLLGEAANLEQKTGNGLLPESVVQAPRDWNPSAWGSFGSEDKMDIDQPGDPYQGTIEEFPGAAAIYSCQQNMFFEHFDWDQFSQERHFNLYYPFASHADWEVRLWLTRSGLSMAAIDSLLSLELVSLDFSY